jgi:hypothetical protein
MANGTLIVTRPRQFADLMRRYRIVVDGEEVGRLKPGGELRVDLPEGQYRMVARIDWAQSNDLSVGIRKGEVTEIEVGANAHGWRLLLVTYFITVGHQQYLYLRHRSTGSPVATKDDGAAAGQTPSD